MEKRKITFSPNRDNTGCLFYEKDCEQYRGAVRISDVIYDVELTLKESAAKPGKASVNYYEMAGSERGGEKAFKGALFIRTPPQTTSPSKAPSFTGDVTMQPGRDKMEVAAWDKVSEKSGDGYLSLSIKPMVAAQQTA